MFGGNSGVSLADIAAVTRGNGDDGGWGGNGWWALIIILALFGWGGEGNGLFGNRGGGSSSTSAEVQRGFDTQGITNKLNGLENGICSLGYDQLAQMNNLNNNITQTGFTLSNAINQASVANMQQAFAAQTQLSNCCCSIERLLADANAARQADTCAITTAISQAAQSIMMNDNANYRQLHDENIAIQMQQKDAEIARLSAALTRCDQRSDNAEQTTTILNTILAAIRGGQGCCNGTWNANVNQCCG